MPPEDPLLARWFVENLQPHETMLRAWLRSQFPAERDIDDLVQESFLRVIEASRQQAIASPKAFLFATARNLALGRIRHQRVTGDFSLTETDAESVWDEGANVADEVARSQEIALLTEAIQSLPERCRQIITLRKIYGLSQKDVAAQLGISEHTVEAQGTIGLRKITEYLQRRKVQPFRP